MSLMNYHELTMNESSDSPARRKQFKLICSIMGGCIAYMVMTSGVLRGVEVSEGTFPGGEFVYKYTGRDYAAVNSLAEAVAKNLGIKEKDHGDTLYSLFLDDPLVINGRNQRFASGILLNENTVTAKQENNKERKKLLMELNEEIVDPTQKEINELAAYELWPRLKYQTQALPKTKSAVVHFKFTNGFVSALVHSYKVFPAIRKYAKEHGASGLVPVVISTCDIAESMCTHYVPLENAEPFRLGKPEQQAEIGNGMINWNGVLKMFYDIRDYILSFTPFGSKSAESTNDEL